MRHIPAIKAVMTPFPHSIDADALANTAFAVMKEHGISHLPVTCSGALVGTISFGTGEDPEGKLKVRDIYRTDPYVADLNERLDHVLMAMAERQVDVVLITRHGRLAGIFTTTDVCRSYAALLRQMMQSGGGDDAA